jgi:tRNA(adenine34) deaminase
MMARALHLARQAADLGEVPVGAVVWELASGRILGEGFNRREIDNNPAAHAEFLAITAACQAIGDWRLNHCALAVTLEPCPMCAGLIVNARLARLVFAAPDPKAGAAGSLFTLTTDPRLNHRVTPIPGVLADQSADLLRSFFRSLRRPDKPPTPHFPDPPGALPPPSSPPVPPPTA